MDQRKPKRKTIKASLHQRNRIQIKAAIFSARRRSDKASCSCNPKSCGESLGQIFPDFSIHSNSSPKIQRQQECSQKSEPHSPHQSVFNTKEVHAMEESTSHKECKAISSKILRQFRCGLLRAVHFRLKPLFKKVNHAPAARSIAGKPAIKTLESDSAVLTIQKIPQNQVRRKIRLSSSFEEN